MSTQTQINRADMLAPIMAELERVAEQQRQLVLAAMRAEAA